MCGCVCIRGRTARAAALWSRMSAIWRGMRWISVRTAWLAPRGDGRWRSTGAVWFSSTATSWRRVALAVTVYPPSDDHLFQLRRRYRTIGCQPACRTPDGTLSTFGLLDLVKL